MSEVSDLIAFVEEMEAKCQRSATARRQSADAWRNGTEDAWEGGRRLAEQQTGLRMPRITRSQRARNAESDERILAMEEADAAKYHAIADHLRSLVAEGGNHA